MKKQNIRKFAGLMAAAAMWVVACTSASAQLIFTGTGTNLGSGTALGGIATFTVTGNQLQLILGNTGAAARVNSDVMTGVFFNWAGISLTADSASSPLLLHYPEGPGPGAGNTLGGGWAYKSTAGNGTTGIGVWGASDDFFSATQNTPPLDGIDYGIISGIAGNASGQVLTAPLAQPSVTFNFTILTLGADLSTLTVIGFNYGTSPSDQTIVPVPEPTTLSLALAGVMALVARRKLKS